MTFTKEELITAFDKAKIQLMSRPDTTFFITVLFSLKHIWDERIPTACTNGLEIRTNPTFFMSLHPEERLFLMLHETLHVAYLHMARLSGRNPQKWNIAADHVINLQLIARGFRMPKGGLADRQYIDMFTEQVYDLIPDDQCKNFDMDLVEGDGDTEALEEAVKEILVRAAVQSKINDDKEGTIPGEIEIFLKKLLSPKLPWQRILQKYINSFAKEDYSFRRPNRRFFPEHILPGLKSEKLMDLALAVDVSGSVTDNQFNQFISDTHSLLKMMKPEKITIVQFDTQVKSIEIVKDLKDLSAMKFTGRGGTAIEPVLHWAEATKPKLLLVFTDGGFRFYQNKYKGELVWLIHNNKTFSPPFGKVIHYEVNC